MFKKQHNSTYHQTTICIVFSLAICFFCFGFSFGQSKEKLESERKKIINEIEKTSKFLDKASQSKKGTLKDLKAIESQVVSRKKLIKNIHSDISRSDATIKKNASKLDSLNSQMKRLTDQYSGVLMNSYLRQLSNSKWTYILSSDNLNTMLLRWRYMNQFESYAKSKKDEIIKLNKNIKNTNEEISLTIEQRKALLVSEENEKNKLESEINKKNKTLKELSGKEEQLKRELLKKSQERERLNTAIESIILAELKKTKEKSNKLYNKKNLELNTNTDKLSNNFSNNKGSLPWPISSGFVSSKYGKQPHPTVKGVTIKNNGIDISSKGNQDARAVFNGTVAGIVKVPGSKHMVIISHGNYHTVYSNLEEVFVRKYQEVNVQQIIGRIVADEDGNSELHFEIYKDQSTTLNPETWLK
jgi:septal ring factor EnvC (AmiA/AmiB activator)